MKAWVTVVVLALAFLAAAPAIAELPLAERAFQNGQTKLKAKRYKQALIYFEATNAVDPDHAGALRGAGDCHYYLGDKPSAVKSYEHYLRFRPDDAAMLAFVQRLKPPTPTPMPTPTMSRRELAEGYSVVAAPAGGERPFVGEALPPPSGPTTLDWISPDELKKAEAASDKPILYDFTAAWCGPCKQMKREVFEAPGFVPWIGNTFITVEVMDRRREDGSNHGRVRNLQTLYAIRGFPTLVIQWRDGKRKASEKVGYGGAQDTMAWLQGQVGGPPVRTGYGPAPGPPP